jgi:hypothetical protein
VLAHGRWLTLIDVNGQKSIILDKKVSSSTKKYHPAFSALE